MKFPAKFSHGRCSVYIHLTGASVGIRPATVAGRQTGSRRTPRGDTRERVRTSYYDEEPGSITLVVDEVEEGKEKRPKREVGKNRGGAAADSDKVGMIMQKTAGTIAISKFTAIFLSIPLDKYFSTSLFHD